jgi:hypothetical protein
VPTFAPNHWRTSAHGTNRANVGQCRISPALIYSGNWPGGSPAARHLREIPISGLAIGSKSSPFVTRRRATDSSTAIGKRDCRSDTHQCLPGCIDSKLRGCDVVALKVEDIAPSGYAVDRATVREKKTGQTVRFEMTEQTRQAVDDYIRAANKKAGEFLFTGRRGAGQCMTTRQYARLVSEWVGSIGLDPRLFGTHSLRRTKATLIYRRTGNLRAVQLLLGHTKIESTVRYLGIEVDDALAIAEQIDV